MNYHLQLKSTNSKTGPIPVSTSNKQTCPTDCGMRDACYAKIGPLNIHWIKISNGSMGVSWEEFCSQIQALPKNVIWRHNQAGDLPGDGLWIYTEMLEQLVNANAGKNGFTYTHYNPFIERNKKAIKHANDNGFTINLSADNISEVDALVDLKIGPVVCVLPMNTPLDHSGKLLTAAGNAVIVCPAVTNEYVTCQTCKLCANKDRTTVIGFPAHGSNKKKADEIAQFA